ncbi:MAG: TetR family transcriptional regulator [Betaproteobacteria bacterium]|nr:TetR family transcriptional regulator [Betaproteobacteria bacterium]
MRAAARIYTSYGYEATTIRDIAAAEGLLPGSIYHYFASKDALILELYSQGIAHIIAAVASATEGLTDPWERLEAACVAHLDTLANGTPHAGVLSKDIPMTSPKLVKALIAMRDQYESIFASYADALEFPTAVESRLFRLQLLGSLNAATRWYRKSGELKPRDIAREFLRNLKRPGEAK